VDLNNLGAAYLDQKKLDEAEKSFKQALTLRQKAVGSDHIRLVGIIDNYVKALRGVDRYEEAVEQEKRAATIRSKHQR